MWGIRQLPIVSIAIAVSLTSACRSPVVAANPASELPPLLHECDLNCNTLRLENGHYVLLTRYRWDTFNGPIIWTVESFTPASVKLHRMYPVDQVFGGQMSPDKNSLVNTTINGAPVLNLKIAWGSALTTVFGSNIERDSGGRLHDPSQQLPSPPTAPRAPGSVQHPASANSNQPPPIMLRANGRAQGPPPCDRNHPPANISVDVELQIAEAYGKRFDAVPYACWAELAASQGKLRAEIDTGEAYFKGIGVAPDAAKGIFWMTKAADKGDDQDAQIWLLQIYSNGYYGIKADPVAAAYWSQREQATEARLGALMGAMITAGVAIMTAPEPCHTLRIDHGNGVVSEQRVGSCGSELVP